MRLVEAIYRKDYLIWLRFADGTEGEVNLEPDLWGDIFMPLRDVKVFMSVRLHPELHTIAWENGADFAPEYLYQKVSAQIRR